MKNKILIIFIILIPLSAAIYFIAHRIAYAKTIIEGRKSVIRGDFDSAVSCYEKAIEKEPKNFELYKELAAIYKFKNQKDKLKETFERGIKISPNDKIFLINCGIFALNEKDYKKAEVYLKKAAEITQTDGKLYFILGRIKQEQNENREALKMFEKALSLGFDQKRCYYNMACLYEYGFKDYEHAMKYYNLYLKQGGDKDNKIAKKMGSYSLIAAGQDLEDKGDFAGAIKEYEARLNENPGNIAIMSRLGRTYRKNNNFPESEKIYIKALHLYKDNYYILNNLGSLYYEIERYDDAFACYRDAIKQNPDLPNAHYNIASLYVRKGDYNLAEEAYNTAKRLGYNEMMVDLQLSELYEKYLKDPVKAKEYKENFLENYTKKEN